MSQGAAYLEYDPLTEEFCGICQRIVPKDAPHRCHPPPLPAQATLRDQFALAALTALLAGSMEMRHAALLASKRAYEIADAMIEARNAGRLNPPPESTSRCAP